MEKNTLAQLQSQFGDIHLLNIDGIEFAFRALTVEETRRFAEFAEDGFDLEDYYVNNAVVYPQGFNFQKCKAGYVTTLAKSIAEVSGLDPKWIISTLDEIRASVDILVQIKAIILAAMPAYTDEFLDTLTIKQILQKLVLSEQILSVQQDAIGSENKQRIYLNLSIEEDKPKAKKKNLNREELLKRIRSGEQDEVNPVNYDPNSVNALNGFDEKLLEKGLGIPQEDDPIARKLRKAMGG